MHKTFSIKDRQIGAGEPAYIIAEVSANHNGDYDNTVRLMEACAEAGVDAIKIQTYTPDTLTIDSDQPYFMIGEGTLWKGQKLYDLYREGSMPWDWQPRLLEVANRLGVHLFSTPYDDTAVDFCFELGFPVMKVASFELVDLPLLRRTAQTGKPVIASTGMASLSEIAEAVDTLVEAGCQDLVLLKCTSAYPALPEEINLRTIPHLAEAFGVAVGLSDHTLGIAVPVAAVVLGACVIEKHVTLSRDVPGPDSAFSLEPQELAEMVQAVRTAEKALGRVSYGVTEKEGASRVFRRSLFVVEDVEAGELFTEKNVRSIRPGYGLHTRYFDEVLGRRAAQKIMRGTPLSWEMVARADGNDT